MCFYFLSSYLSLALKLFFNAESLIYQNKSSEALSILEKIFSQHPDALIRPLSSLRLAILLTEFKKFDKASKIALSIENSYFNSTKRGALGWR